LFALGLLGAVSVLLSDLPAWACALLAPAAAGHGAWLARREWRRPGCALDIDADGRVTVAGTAAEIAAPRLRVRGSLASLQWSGTSLVWCADTLPPASRRQLLLRAGGRNPA